MQGVCGDRKRAASQGDHLKGFSAQYSICGTNLSCDFPCSITTSAGLLCGFLGLGLVKLQQQVINRGQLDFRQVTRVEQPMEALCQYE